MAGRDWSIGSAGLRARAGATMDPHAAEVLTERGQDVTGWQTTPLSAGLVQQADLILVATAEHRRAVAAVDPAAARRTLLLLQFGAMAAVAGGHQDLTRLSAARTVEAAAAARPFLDPRVDWDLHDPVGGSVAEFRECADRIAAAVAPLR